MKRKIWIVLGIAFGGLMTVLAWYDFVATLIVIALAGYFVGGSYVVEYIQARRRNR